MLPLCFVRLATVVLGALLPAYSSFQAIRSTDPRPHLVLLVYWVCFALFTAAELVLDAFLWWLPLYGELKLLFLLWLLAPQYKGAVMLYRCVLHDWLVEHQGRIDDALRQMRVSESLSRAGQVAKFLLGMVFMVARMVWTFAPSPGEDPAVTHPTRRASRPMRFSNDHEPTSIPAIDPVLSPAPRPRTLPVVREAQPCDAEVCSTGTYNSLSSAPHTDSSLLADANLDSSQLNTGHVDSSLLSGAPLDSSMLPGVPLDPSLLSGVPLDSSLLSGSPLDSSLLSAPPLDTSHVAVLSAGLEESCRMLLRTALAAQAGHQLLLAGSLDQEGGAGPSSAPPAAAPRRRHHRERTRSAADGAEADRVDARGSRSSEKKRRTRGLGARSRSSSEERVAPTEPPLESGQAPQRQSQRHRRQKRESEATATTEDEAQRSRRQFCQAM